MSKHTPGSWAVHYHDNTDTYTIHVAGKSWESWAVAHVGDCTQDEANARLIAAAPELLNLLCLALPYIEEAEHDPCYKPELVRALTSKIRAAIERAS